MRFATLSLLLALGIGYVSGIEKPYKQACGIDDIDNANLADCKLLLDNDKIWTEAQALRSKDGLDSSAKADGLTKLASYKQCHLFHRFGPKAHNGFNTDDIRLEARDLLGCHGNDTVNGRAIFGSDLENSKSHYLCITGDPDQGEDCLGGDDDGGYPNGSPGPLDHAKSAERQKDSVGTMPSSDVSPTWHWLKLSSNVVAP